SLLAGEIQMAVANGTIAVTAAARGAPIVIIATIGPTKYSLVSVPGISSVQELRGKTIGIGGYGVGDYFVLRRLLQKLGLDVQKDVTLFPIGTTSSTERIKVMLTGKVDATMATSNNIASIEARGEKLNILAAVDEQGVDVSGGSFYTTRDNLSTRREQIKGILKAVSDAISMGRQNKELFFAAMRKYLREDDPKLLQKYYEGHYFLGTKPHGATPLEKGLDLDIKDLSVNVPELKGRKAEEFIDTTLLKEVEAEGYFSWVKQ
ncbi:MAG: ABC transporter substrate-binding protein, partial [Candidatus Binatia bacterium]